MRYPKFPCIQLEKEVSIVLFHLTTQYILYRNQDCASHLNKRDFKKPQQIGSLDNGGKQAAHGSALYGKFKPNHEESWYNS
jgi:hypothetical protein